MPPAITLSEISALISAVFSTTVSLTEAASISVPKYTTPPAMRDNTVPAITDLTTMSKRSKSFNLLLSIDYDQKGARFLPLKGKTFSSWAYALRRGGVVSGICVAISIRCHSVSSRSDGGTHALSSRLNTICR